MKYFDIIPPKESKKTMGNFDLLRFFLIALVSMTVLSVGSMVTKGEFLLFQSQDFALAGWDNLKGGVIAFENKDFKSASIIFAGAQGAFKDLSDEMRSLTAQGSQLVGSGQFLNTANKLIQLGISASKVGKQASEFIQSAEYLSAELIRQNLRGIPNEALMNKIHDEKARLKSIISEVIGIQRNLETMNQELLPKSIQHRIKEAREPMAKLIRALTKINKNMEAILRMAGDKTPHRYLVLFQNRYERRATGGFIGSYALIDVNDGVVTKIDVKDIYESDGQLGKFVEAPAGISDVADRLYMRDANYSPDFPISAKSIMWFLEQSKGPSVDTVIAIDQSVAESLLKIIGPINLASLNLTVDENNFNDVFSFLIESKASDAISPKDFLIRFIPKVKEKLLSLKSITEVTALATDLFKSKSVQMYSTDPKIQSLAKSLNIDGGMVYPDKNTDFLAFVTTSIGGNKSDRFIKTELTHQTRVQRNGTLTDSLTIKKEHTFNQESFKTYSSLIKKFGTGKVNKTTLRYILGEGPNVDYLRIYVPKGSRIINTSGIDDLVVSEDLGYTVFAFKFTVEAGNTQVASLNYKLPFNLSFDPADSYRFVAQSQAGANNITLNKTFVTEDGLAAQKSYPASTSAFLLNPEYKVNLNSNKFFLSAFSLGI